MPTLDWMGKERVINHHRDAAFRTLTARHHFDAQGEHAPRPSSGDENMIIHGDNLDALKALLPRYGGRIKCIYIDPPYNTGNEGWVYNDNVGDPRIKRWLGQVVGREGEDLSRHDKWLCMMYPRLRLMRELLADDGAIFISIDDNEQANLRLLCDEIFGAYCFVSKISWQRTYSTRNDSKGIVNEVEYLLVYSKKPNWIPNKLPRTENMNSMYKNPDNDITPWASDNPFAPGAATHQGMVYAIQHPFTGELLYPSSNACWRYQQDTMLEIMNGWCPYELRDIEDAERRAAICGIPVEKIRQNVFAIMLSEPLETARQKANVILKRGQWPKFYFTKKGYGGIRRKTYLKNVGDIPPSNYWPYSEVGHTDEAKKELLAIFNGRGTFDTPKPRRLIERVLQIACDKDAIILDCFAGSGTTAHAVLNLNASDGGNRQFILVEMMDYASSITAERVKRVITGYTDGKNAVPGTGGDFTFYELGEPIFLPNGTLNPSTPKEKIQEYVWHAETNSPYAIPEHSGNHTGFLGRLGDTDWHFLHEPGLHTALDIATLNTILETETIRGPAARRVVFADFCLLDDDTLNLHHIVFKKIPTDINRF